MNRIKIFSNAAAIDCKSNEVFTKSFGGVTLYAKTERALLNGVAEIRKKILEAVKSEAGCTPRIAKWLIEQELGVQIEKRVFSAVLGSLLREGQLEEVLCEGSKGTPFRLIFCQDSYFEFQERFNLLVGIMICKEKVSISQIREIFFNKSGKGSWTKASFIAARVVRLGLARYVDQYRIEIAGPVKNATSGSELILGRPLAQWVAIGKQCI